ncbi:MULTISPECIES: restriction endonuclease subunit S [unclassified Pseudoalteromonas]|uniref:restriction endonuclease subunit S n=1 Tax=unclassified Pseudoalteromonas TaxID=194690 RepID=UPI0021166A60|nr:MULTISPECIES: restriction endonuclease subunit S [unclassified Pseudoalteromonas]
MGWSISKMSEVTNIISGGTPKSGISDYWFGDVKWITPKDMGKITGIYVSETGRNITRLGLEKSSAKLIPESSVILSTRAPIGHLAINKVPMATNQGCRGLVPKSTLDTKFLYYFLLKSVSLLNDLGSGTTFKELSKTALEKVEIPHPEITEQKRIVAILDQAFADIEQARAKAEQNLKNARELFESYLQQVFSLRGEGWVEITLGDAAEVSTGGTPLKSKNEFWDGDIPWYSSGELNDTFTIESKSCITAAGLDGSNAKILPEGSLLVGMYDTAALKMSILDRDGAFNQAIAGVKPNNRINLEFILHSINSIKPELLKLRRGVRQKNLNKSKIKGIPIRLPSLSEQNQVVEELRLIRRNTDDLAVIYTQKLNDLDELKKSILQKAFSGELTKEKEGAVA